MTSPYMDVAEASEYLRCSAATLRRYVREGKLQKVRLSARKVLYIRDEVVGLAERNTYKVC